MYQFDALQPQELSRLIHEKRHRLLGRDCYRRYGLDFPLTVRSVILRRGRFFRIGVSARVLRHPGHDGSRPRSLWYAVDDVPSLDVRQGDVFFSLDGDRSTNSFADRIANSHADRSTNRFDDADRIVYTPLQDEGVQLVGSPLFTTAIYDLDDPETIDYSELDSFVLLTAVQGSADVADDSGQRLTICEGHSLLIPATTKNIKIEGTIRLLETYV